MKKCNLKQISSLIFDTILEEDTNVYIQWYLAILDTIETKLCKPQFVKPKKKTPKYVCKTLFQNKGVEMINLPRILHSPELTKEFPKEAGVYSPPTVVYKLDKTIRSSIFNFGHFVETLDVDAFLKDEKNLPCHCEESQFSQFADNFHNHIISGDLRIVSNGKLRKLLSKGPNYREPVSIDFGKAKVEISLGLDSVINTWSAEYGQDCCVFREWKETVLKLIDTKIEQLNRNFKHTTIIPKLEQPKVKHELKTLQDKFVMTPIDKASGNIAFICKRFYAKVLMKELGIDSPSNASPTYKKINKDPNVIIENHTKYLSNMFKINVEDEFKSLPKIYWLPKLHKSPIKFRFIIAASTNSIKPLAKPITSILKRFYQQIENYNKKAHFFSGIKTFWVVKDKTPVLEAVKNINSRKRAQCVSSFDFSTLYTTIPHDKLTFVMDELTDFCYKGCKDRRIKITKFGAEWVTEKYGIYNGRGAITFTKEKIKLAIKYLLDNCFFKLGSHVFQQTIGIPMGSDPAPFMANLFLYYYENKYMKQLTKVDVRMARKFGNIFRFIDDLHAMNDGQLFSKVYKDIYPKDQELKKENDGFENATFLDLENTIIDKEFDLKLYDKRDAFPFSIVRMPYLCSNMPSRIFYATIGSEILRIATCTSKKENLITSCT